MEAWDGPLCISVLIDSATYLLKINSPNMRFINICYRSHMRLYGLTYCIYAILYNECTMGEPFFSVWWLKNFDNDNDTIIFHSSSVNTTKTHLRLMHVIFIYVCSYGCAQSPYSIHGLTIVNECSLACPYCYYMNQCMFMCMCEYYNIITSTPLIDAHLRSCMIVMSLCKARVYRLINLSLFEIWQSLNAYLYLRGITMVHKFSTCMSPILNVYNCWATL